MNRFKASKYKNAFSHVYKKEVCSVRNDSICLFSHILISCEQMWINDLSVGSNLRSSSHHISASSKYIAFVHDSNSEYLTVNVTLACFMCCRKAPPFQIFGKGILVPSKYLNYKLNYIDIERLHVTSLPIPM